jgi:arylsulfatase
MMAGIPVGDAPSILNKSYTITAEVEIPQGGGEGMLATLGGRFGGYGLYVLKGKPVFTYNLVDLERFRWEGQEALTPGKHTIVFDFKYDGPGFGKGGTGVLSVDGKQAATKTIPHTIPFLMTIDETFDVGVDTRTGADDRDYQVPFRFTGTLAKLTIKLGPEQLAEADRKVMQEALARARD